MTTLQEKLDEYGASTGCETWMGYVRECIQHPKMVVGKFTELTDEFFKSDIKGLLEFVGNNVPLGEYHHPWIKHKEYLEALSALRAECCKKNWPNNETHYINLLGQDPTEVRRKVIVYDANNDYPYDSKFLEENPLLLANRLCGKKIRKIARQGEMIFELGGIKSYVTNRPGDGKTITKVEYLINNGDSMIVGPVYGRAESIELDISVIKMLLVTGKGEKMPPKPDEGRWEVVTEIKLQQQAKQFSDEEVILILQNFAKDNDISSNGIKIGKWFEEHKTNLKQSDGK